MTQGLVSYYTEVIFVQNQRRISLSCRGQWQEWDFCCRFHVLMVLFPRRKNLLICVTILSVNLNVLSYGIPYPILLMHFCLLHLTYESLIPSVELSVIKPSILCSCQWQKYSSIDLYVKKNLDFVPRYYLQYFVFFVNTSFRKCALLGIFVLKRF